MAIDRVEIQIAPARKEGRIMIERWTNEARRHAGEFARTGNWRAYKYSLMTVLALKLRINEAKTQKLVERVNPETFFARLGRVMQKQSANSAPVDSTIATSSDEQPPQQQLRTTTRKREVKKQPARRELSVVGMVSPMLEGHERTILSYLLNGHGGAREFLHRVAERIFSNPIHGTILHAIRDVFDQGDEVNFITVSNRLDEMKALANCGGQGGIVEISNETSSAEIVESALECVLEAYQERETIRIGERLHSGEITGEQAVAQLQSIEQISEPSELPPPPSPYKPPPLDLLPSVLQDFVHAVAESINVDVGFTFLPTLSAVGTAIGNSRSILLKRGFVQPPVIWSAIIARSGGRKSPTIDAATFAITEHERELIQQNEEAMEIYNEQLADWNSQSKKARGEKPTRPTFLTCYTDDLTFESLGELAVMNPRGFIVRKDELSHWFASFDQYKDAKGSDVARWLTLHSAFPLAVDRRTDRRHYRIMNPRVCITGGIQPKILRRVLTPEYFERGLPARFIFDYPPFRQDRWNNTSVPEKLRTQVLKLFEQLWLLQPTGSNPFLLTFEPDAKALFIDFYNQCGESALEAGEHEEATWGKLSGYGSRFALVGQVAQQPNAEIATTKVTQSACELALWQGSEARRIYSELSETREQRELRGFCEFVQRRGMTVTIRDVITYNWSLKNNREKAEQLAQAAIKAGLGRWEDALTTIKGGRPTRVFRLIPALNSAQPPSVSLLNSGGCADAEDPINE